MDCNSIYIYNVKVNANTVWLTVLLIINRLKIKYYWIWDYKNARPCNWIIMIVLIFGNQDYRGMELIHMENNLHIEKIEGKKINKLRILS